MSNIKIYIKICKLHWKNNILSLHYFFFNQTEKGWCCTGLKIFCYRECLLKEISCFIRREIIPEFAWQRQANVYQQSPCVGEASKPLERKKSRMPSVILLRSLAHLHPMEICRARWFPPQQMLSLLPCLFLLRSQPQAHPWPLLSHPHPITSLHPLHVSSHKIKALFLCH